MDFPSLPSSYSDDEPAFGNLLLSYTLWVLLFLYHWRQKQKDNHLCPHGKFLGDNQPDRDKSHCPHVNLLMKEYCCKKSSACLLANPPHQYFSSPILHPWKTQGGSRSYLACPHWPPHPWRGWPSVRVHLPCFPYICYSDSFRQRLHYPTGRNLFLNHRDYNSIKDWWEQNAYCVAFSVLI